MVPELTPILVAVATVGVGLAALMVGLFAWLRQDIRQLESRTNERFDQVRDRIDALERYHQERFASLDRGQAGLRERMAKLEGLLEGLREAITGHRAAS